MAPDEDSDDENHEYEDENGFRLVLQLTCFIMTLTEVQIGIRFVYLAHGVGLCGSHCKLGGSGKIARLSTTLDLSYFLNSVNL